MTPESAEVLGRLVGEGVFALLLSLVLALLVWLIRGRKGFWSSWIITATIVFGILVFKHLSTS